MKTIHPYRSLTLLAVLCSVVAAQADLIKPVTSSGSSEYPGGGYVVSYLFDGTPAIGSSANVGNQYACNGTTESQSGVVSPIVGMDFGNATNFSFTAVGYAQRGGAPNCDSITQMKLWFSNSPIVWSLKNPPARTPDETLTISTANANFAQYNFSTTRSGRYVVAQFLGGTCNPGGCELRLIGTGTAIPMQYFSGASGTAWDASTADWGNTPGGPYTAPWGGSR